MAGPDIQGGRVSEEDVYKSDAFLQAVKDVEGLVAQFDAATDIKAKIDLQIQAIQKLAIIARELV